MCGRVEPICVSLEEQWDAPQGSSDDEIITRTLMFAQC